MRVTPLPVHLHHLVLLLVLVAVVTARLLGVLALAFASLPLRQQIAVRRTLHNCFKDSYESSESTKERHPRFHSPFSLRSGS